MGNPSNPLICSMCNKGHCQSPINIVTTTNGAKLKIVKDDEIKLNPLIFNYPSKVENCTIVNNGKMVQININPSNKCILSINNKEYILRHFYFHTPSEHTIDSKQYEMEMHLVHIAENDEIAVLGFIFSTDQKYQKKPTLKLSNSRMHLVLSPKRKKKGSMVMEHVNTLKTMPESEEEPDDESEDEQNQKDGNKKDENEKDQNQKEEENDFLAQFWNELPLKKTDDDIPLNKPICSDYLFETSSNNFIKSVKTNEINIDMALFEYTGSLTTPPYTEGVQWLISKTKHFISNKQLKQLSSCWNHENNARPIQETHGRTVSLRSKTSLSIET